MCDIQIKFWGVYSGLHALESYSGHRSTIFAMSYGMYCFFSFNGIRTKTQFVVECVFMYTQQ